MTRRGPTLLFDIDGTVLDWLGPFCEFMRLHDHPYIQRPEQTHDLLPNFPSLGTAATLTAWIDQFAHTAGYNFLRLYPDVERAVAVLRAARDDVLLIGVSCCGTTSYIRNARANSLRALGLDALFCLPQGADKRDIFERFSPGAIVFEDNPHHLVAAQEAGHAGILKVQPYNTGVEADHHLEDWSELTHPDEWQALFNRFL